MIGKAEYGAHSENVRFLVTSLSPKKIEARCLYENRYCPRTAMGNRFKEQQLYLFGRLNLDRFVRRQSASAVVLLGRLPPSESRTHRGVCW